MLKQPLQEAAFLLTESVFCPISKQRYNMTKSELKDTLFLKYKAKIDQLNKGKQTSVDIMNSCYDRIYERLILGAQFLNMQVIDDAFRRELEMVLNVSLDPRWKGEESKKKSFLGLNIPKNTVGLIVFVIIMVIIVLFVFSFL
jgi:hypothetical protein